MRTLAILALLALPVLSQPAGAQSPFPVLDPGRVDRPNTGGKPPAGPNTAIIQSKKAAERQTYYPSCGTVRATPLRRGDPGYGRHLDPDGSGVACKR